MNRKRKILTLFSLAMFGVIITLHNGHVFFGDYPHTSPQRWPSQDNITKEWHIKNWRLAQ